MLHMKIRRTNKEAFFFYIKKISLIKTQETKKKFKKTNTLLEH